MSSDAVVNKAVYIAFSLSVTMISGVLSYIFYKYLKRDVMPLKWRRVGILEQIYLYPIKSCAPIEFTPENEILCELLSLRYGSIRDRALMLINDNDEVVSARLYPKLVLINCKVMSETKLLLNAEDMEPLEIDLATLADEGPGKDINTTVWGSKVKGMLCGEKYDKWFSRFILNNDSGLRLLYYPYPKPTRLVNYYLAKEPFITHNDTGTFGDATSYMLMNLSSVDDLNTRLPRKVDPLQFRGNFNLKMDKNEPYAEDDWQWIRIGNNAVFRKVAPCTRCIFPNINVKTGERDPDGEPLKMLRSYRLINNRPSPTLGIHLGLRAPGSIKVNDIIYVEDNEQTK